jgi:hypothetical protein
MSEERMSEERMSEGGLAEAIAEMMGPRLQAYVEEQLLADLRHYGVATDGLTVDWSDFCPEGHVTEYLGGRVANWSAVVVRAAAGRPVAGGWMDFVHGGGDDPLFVFWHYLSVFRGGSWHHVKDEPGVPPHVWQRLPAHAKALGTKQGEYPRPGKRQRSVP